MTAVINTSATASATGAPIGSRRCSSGLSEPAKVAPPKAADKKPARVTPICTAERNWLGLACSLATAWPRLPRWASCFTWLSRSETSAISAAANTPPMAMNTTINAALRRFSFMSRSRAQA